MTLSTRLLGLLALLPAAACATLQTRDLPLVRGYRAPADQCMLIGESAFTNQWLDHTADLVGCPEDYEGLGVFLTETGASPVAEHGGYLLFSVQRH